MFYQITWISLYLQALLKSQVFIRFLRACLINWALFWKPKIHILSAKKMCLISFKSINQLLESHAYKQMLLPDDGKDVKILQLLCLCSFQLSWNVQGMMAKMWMMMDLQYIVIFTFVTAHNAIFPICLYHCPITSIMALMLHSSAKFPWSNAK